MIEFSLGKDVLLEHTYPRSGDVTFVSGTLIEGIGNEFSDLDIYVLTEELRRADDIEITRHHRVLTPERDIVRSGKDEGLVYLIHTLLPGSDIKTDVEFRTHAQIALLFQRLDQIYKYAASNLVLLTKTIESRDKKFIHRLLTGRPISGGDSFLQLRERLRVQEYCYVAYRWVASDFSVVLDILGAWRQGEWIRCADMAREYALQNLQGYLHLRGLTNASCRKWLPVYLDQYGDVPSSLLADIKRIYVPGAKTSAELSLYVEHALDFVDHLFEISLPYLAQNSAAPSGNEALNLLKEDRRHANLSSRYAELEYEYRAKAYGGRSAPTRSYLYA
jgi:hypothetical protein